MNNQQSFDVYLPDYSSITAESTGKGSWELYWIDELGENRVCYGRKLGSRDDVMLHCEALAETFNGEK